MASSPFEVTASAIPKVVCGGLWLGFAAQVARLIPVVGRGTSGLQDLLGLLILFIGAIVASFSVRFMRADPRRDGYFVCLAALVAAAAAFVFAGNVVVFANGWVASGLLLAQLIGHARDWDEAAVAAARARRTFLLGDLAILAALAILAGHAQSLSLADLLTASKSLAPSLQATAALLLLVGAAARCALPPFSNWLLTSMTAPTPVSALMHAGLVNAGGFVLLRFAPLFEAAPSVRFVAVAIGFVAALWGLGVMAVRSDIKRSLAGSTVSQMGFMIMSCGLGAYTAAAWHLVAHGLFKAWLFLGAGSAVGMTAADTRHRPARRSVSVAAGFALVAAGVMTGTGAAGAGLVPLVLAGATAVFAFAAVLQARISAPARLALLGAVMAIAGLHVLGIQLAHNMVGDDRPAFASPAVSWTLLLLFLGSWLWQARGARGRSAVPASLYVRLLNAGSNSAAHTGAQQ